MCLNLEEVICECQVQKLDEMKREAARIIFRKTGEEKEQQRGAELEWIDARKASRVAERKVNADFVHETRRTELFRFADREGESHRKGFWTL